MIRKSAVSGPAYFASAIGVLFLSVFAWRIMGSYPVTGVVLLVTALVAFAGLGHGWHRHLRKQRLREQPDQMKI